MKYRLLNIAFCFLIFPALALAGHSAFDNMTELDDELGDLTGQVGITIGGSIELVDGYAAWIDQDGLNGDADNNGVLLLDNLKLNGIGGYGPLKIQGLHIDAGTNSSGNSFLIIQLPKISGSASIGNISLGKDIEDARDHSLGSLTITDIDLATGKTQVCPH